MSAVNSETWTYTRADAYKLLQILDSEHERYLRAVGYLPRGEERLQEDLRRYLCLRCSGFLEQLTYEVLTDYLLRKSYTPIGEWATSFFRHAPNLNLKAFASLLARFGESYSTAFEKFINHSGRRDLLTNLLDVRNTVAHGGVIGGQRLDPTPYIRLCRDTHDWLVTVFIDERFPSDATT